MSQRQATLCFSIFLGLFTPCLQAEVLVNDSFAKDMPKEWSQQMGARLSTSTEPLLGGPALRMESLTSFSAAVRSFPTVSLRPGDRIRLEFDILYPADMPLADSGLRFGLIHSGTDGSVAGKAAVNDRGYGLVAGLAESKTIFLSQDSGTEGTALGGKDSSPRNLSEGGGVPSGEPFTGVKGGKPVHCALEITRTPSGILLDSQVGGSFRSSQDKTELQTEFNALIISNGMQKSSLQASQVRVELFPAKP